MIPRSYTRMQQSSPILTLNIAITLILLTLPGATAAAEPGFHGPLLQWHRDPTQSITFSWVEQDGKSSWNLGVRPRGSSITPLRIPIEESRFGDTDYPLFRAAINGLRPGNEYEYTLTAGRAVVKTGWFRTAPARLSAPISFVVGGDMDTAPSIPVSRLAAAQDPLFAMVGGDLAYGNGKDAEKWFDWLDNWTKILVGSGGRDIPIIACVGNHETKGLWFLRSPAPFYVSLFDLPSGKTSFTVDFGGYMSIVVLDSDHVQRVEAQTSWLEQQLSRRQDLPNLFVLYHRPAWGTGVKKNRKNIQKEWCPLFEKYGVDCVFENDHHVFKRTRKIAGGVPDQDKGVLYIGDGAWGAALRPITDSHLDRVGARAYLAHWDAIHHLVKVTVSPGGMKTYEARAPGKGVFDTFKDAGTSPSGSPGN